MISSMESGMLDYNNGQMYYEVTGRGEPIVFAHGFTLDHRMWQPQVAFFAQDYRVVTYDARGFGKSSTPNGPYDHTADLHALLEYLDARPAHIVGLSMGGRVATNYALAYPDMVHTLTLMDAALDGHANEIDWVVRAKQEGVDKARQNWIGHELFAATRRRPQVVTALRTMIQDYSGWHWLNNDPKEPADTRARDYLNDISSPALIMVGEADLPYFHTISDILTSGIPDAHKITVPHAGHMVNLEAPEYVNHILADFIINA